MEVSRYCEERSNRQTVPVENRNVSRNLCAYEIDFLLLPECGTGSDNTGLFNAVLDDYVKLRQLFIIYEL
jgi:hypothetical protein